MGTRSFQLTKTDKVTCFWFKKNYPMEIKILDQYRLAKPEGLKGE
jgi:hypothetical protein